MRTPALSLGKMTTERDAIAGWVWSVATVAEVRCKLIYLAGWCPYQPACKSSWIIIVIIFLCDVDTALPWFIFLTQGLKTSRWGLELVKETTRKQSIIIVKPSLRLWIRTFKCTTMKLTYHDIRRCSNSDDIKWCQGLKRNWYCNNADRL